MAGVYRIKLFSPYHIISAEEKQNLSGSLALPNSF